MRFRSILLGSIPLALTIVPLAAHATGLPFFGPIIPADSQTCPGTLALLLTVINRIVAFLITFIIVFVTPLSIGYAGFLMVINPTGMGSISKAKSIITNTIVGVVISLAAWLIVGALMNVVYNGAKYGAWQNTLQGTGDFCINLAASKEPEAAPSSGTTSTAPSSGEEAAIRAQLAAAGVSINNAPCPEGSSGSGCTNVAGMQSATVQQIININQACGGGVTVTGGTEPGHASGTYSHGNGYKVDLRLTDSLTSCLEGMAYIGVRTGDHAGPAYADTCGQNQYVKESDHWDITVMGACATLKSATQQI